MVSVLPDLGLTESHNTLMPLSNTYPGPPPLFLKLGWSRVKQYLVREEIKVLHLNTSFEELGTEDLSKDLNKMVAGCKRICQI